MIDLDAMCKSGKYFQSQCRQRKTPNMVHIHKAVRRLGGELTVEWKNY
jgi:hypothetical protein